MDEQKVSRQRKWQLARKAAGKCMTCGDDRGETGGASYCEKCREKRNAQQRDRHNFSGSIWD